MSRRLASAQEKHALTSAIIGLPVPVRDVFLLHRMAGFSYEEIADHLGIEASQVTTMLAEALVQLVRAVRLSETPQRGQDGANIGSGQ